MSIILAPLVMTVTQTVAHVSSLVFTGLSCVLMGSLVTGYMAFWAMVVLAGPIGLYVLCCIVPPYDPDEELVDLIQRGLTDQFLKRACRITAQAGQTSHIATQPTWSVEFRRALGRAADEAGECQFKTVIWATIEAGKSYLVFTGEGPYPHLRGHLIPSETLVILAPPSADTERREPIDFVKELSGDATLKDCTVITALWNELQFIRRNGRFPERLIGEMNPCADA